MTNQVQNELTVVDNVTALSVAQKPSRFSESDINDSQITAIAALPVLDKLKSHFMSLEINYWTPEKSGEEKYCFVMGIDNQPVPDMKTGEIINLECVLLVERVGDKLLRWRNGSRILVGTIKDAIRNREIEPGTTLTPVCITYLGKKRSKSGNQCDNWQVTPLIYG